MIQVIKFGRLRRILVFLQLLEKHQHPCHGALVKLARIPFGGRLLPAHEKMRIGSTKYQFFSHLISSLKSHQPSRRFRDKKQPDKNQETGEQPLVSQQYIKHQLEQTLSDHYKLNFVRILA